MPEYEVGVRAFTHIMVEADSAEEAAQKAAQQADSLTTDWEIDDTDVHELQ